MGATTKLPMHAPSQKKSSFSARSSPFHLKDGFSPPPYSLRRVLLRIPDTTMSLFFRPAFCLLALAMALPVSAEDLPPPTVANLPYGSHANQVLDFWKADTAQPAPLVFSIHGGGWMGGDKANPDFLKQCLGAGISVVSINYRFIPDAIGEKIDPPVKACLDDAARALQFVRSKATEWNLDKKRVACCGGSAGGFTSLWLAFHPEMANPQSSDLIARESTRVTCVLAFVPQTSLDPKQMHEWIPNNDYGHHAFALPTMQAFIDKRESLMHWIKEFSPYELATSDDPPVLLYYDSVPELGRPYRDPPHSANFGAGIAPKLKAVGIEYELNVTGAQNLKYPDLFSFLTEKLGVKAAK